MALPVVAMGLPRELAFVLCLEGCRGGLYLLKMRRKADGAACVAGCPTAMDGALVWKAAALFVGGLPNTSESVLS